MNLTQALNMALPELPVQQLHRQRPPKLDSALIAREHLEEGRPMVYVLPPKATGFYPLTVDQWALLQLFDGERSFAEIADEFTAQTASLLTEEDARAFYDQLRDVPLWYKSPQEKSIALLQSLKDERQKRLKRKAKWGDLSMITFPAFDPDKFLAALYQKINFIFTRWFVVLNVALFGFMIYVFVDRWSEIGQDTLEYYTFTNKGIGHLAEFWILVLFLGFVHETAHGITCKHVGGEVHRMGFLLIYLAPGFYCDTTEAWIYGERWQRVIVALAGIWSEMILCSIATIVWWGTPRGSPVHEFAYTLILITGVAVIVINMNPLIKLDGYTVFTEALGVPELKERSTAFVSGWVKKHIFGLPVELEYLPLKRKVLFIPYAIASGLYSYLLLYAIIRFSRNVFYQFTPDWAFVPALALALLVFKSRIRTFGRFVRAVYLDKRERLNAWFTPPRKVAAAVAGAVFLVVPIWRESVEGRFMLEPVRLASIRAAVPGTVSKVLVDEGQPVGAGQPVLILRNLKLESEAAKARADLRVTTAQATRAQLAYVSYGEANRKRQAAAVRGQTLQEQVGQLTLASPLNGILLTARLHDRFGSTVEAGTEVAEVGDTSIMRARIYVPESEIRKVRTGDAARLYFSAMGRSMEATVDSILPAAVEEPTGLMEKQQYKGIRPPQYYVATALFPNQASALRTGMTGGARIVVGRRSIAGFIWLAVRQFALLKLW